jgi:SulP family sulfate permease
MAERAILQELHPERLLPSLVTRLVVRSITTIIQLSFAALIFSGGLTAYVSRGIGFCLFGAMME